MKIATRIEKEQVKENQAPLHLPTMSGKKPLTIRLPARPFVASDDMEDDSWEPPPVAVAFQAQLGKRPITAVALDDSSINTKRHRYRSPTNPNLPADCVVQSIPSIATIRGWRR